MKLLNESLEFRVVPNCFQTAVIRPFLNLNPNSLKSYTYRLVSNMPYIPTPGFLNVLWQTIWLLTWMTAACWIDQVPARLSCRRRHPMCNE